jgi:hypothetical protein
VRIQPHDMSKLVGTWQGTVIYPSKLGFPGTLFVYPDRTYAIEAGAFTWRGTVTLVNGRLDFISGNGLALENRTGSATLVDQGSSWGLTGPGGAGPGLFNFDFSKPK